MTAYRDRKHVLVRGGERTRRGRLRSLRRRLLIRIYGTWRERRWRCGAAGCRRAWGRRGELGPGWAKKWHDAERPFTGTAGDMARALQGCPACVPTPRDSLKPQTCATCRRHMPWSARDYSRPDWFCLDCHAEIRLGPHTEVLIALRAIRSRHRYVMG